MQLAKDGFKICSNPNCIHGGRLQPISNFSKNKNTKDGYEHHCKDCKKIYRRKMYLKHQEKNKQRSKEWSQNNSEKQKQMQRSWLQVNKKKKIELNNKWFKKLCSWDSIYKEKLMKYEEIRQDPKNLELLQVKCFNSNCQNWFNPTNSQIACRLNSINGTMVGENHLYCSDKCKKTCSIYGTNKFKRNQDCNLHTEILQGELRELVIQERGEICEICGKSKEDFPDETFYLHHIIPVAEEPMLASDKDNMLILCEEHHHKLVHQLPGCTFQEIAKKARLKRELIKKLKTS